MQDVKVDRNKYIGGSDIPIIMGISPFKSRFDLLLEKAELKDNCFNGNEYTEYGNVMEEKIRNYINKKYNFNFLETKTFVDDCRYHADGDDEEKQYMLEIKTTSQIHEKLRDYKIYIVQLLKGMMMKNYKLGKLAVYERPDDFDEEFDKERLTIYDLVIDDFKDLCDEINKAVDQFRIDLAKVKENPFITEEELIPADLTTLSNKVLELENQLKSYDELKKQYETFKEELRQAMINNGVKKWITPNNTQITLILDIEDKEVLKFNEDKFKEENDKLYSKYLETKIQKGRKGSVKITPPKEEK